MYTFSCPWTDFGSRSASISYFRILKHSSRSSKKCPYVRTQAEQSQARKKIAKKVNIINLWDVQVILSSQEKDYFQPMICEHLEVLTNWTGIIFKVGQLENMSSLLKIQKFFPKSGISFPQGPMYNYKCF